MRGRKTKIAPNSVSAWFSGYTKLAEIEHLDYLDTSNATSFMSMFGSCQKLTELDLSSFDTSNVVNMFGTFMNCSVLENLNVHNWDTSNVEDMQLMFCKCDKLVTLDLYDFDTNNVISMTRMFFNSTILHTIQVSSLWKTADEQNNILAGTNNATITVVE